MDDRRLGYPPAANEFFEEMPHWYVMPYGAGLPKRVLQNEAAMHDLFGFPMQGESTQPITTVHGIACMTDQDKRVLAADVGKPIAVLTPKPGYLIVRAVDPKIAEADAHAVEQERKAQQ